MIDTKIKEAWAAISSHELRPSSPPYAAYKCIADAYVEAEAMRRKAEWEYMHDTGNGPSTACICDDAGRDLRHNFTDDDWRNEVLKELSDG